MAEGARWACAVQRCGRGRECHRRHLGTGWYRAPVCTGSNECHEVLQVDSDGNKIGKSTGGAVWLSAEKLSPYKFYQYLFNTTDTDVVRFLKMLTFLPMEEVREVEAAMARDDYTPNTAQKLLAQEVTRFVHGEDGLQARAPHFWSRGRGGWFGCPSVAFGGDGTCGGTAGL